MYEYLDDKYKENTPPPKKTFSVIGVFVSAFIIMLVLVLSEPYVFKKVFTCDETKCVYSSSNIYGQQKYNKTFLKNDIKKLYVSLERYSRDNGKTEYYEEIYNVLIHPDEVIHFSKEPFRLLIRYYNGKIDKIKFREYANLPQIIGYGTVGFISFLLFIGFLSQLLKKTETRHKKH